MEQHLIEQEYARGMQMAAMQQNQQWGCKGGGKGKGGDGKGKWAKGGNAPPAKKQTAPIAADLPFRARLNQALQGKFKDEFSAKENLEYTTVQEGAVFTCELSSDKFSQPYSSDGPAASRKQAEENAAMKAFKEEFPELFRSVPQAVKKMAADLRGEKRKAGDAGVGSGAGQGSGGKDPKSLLNMGVTIMVGRSILKGEVDYIVEEKGSFCQAKCTVNCDEIEGAPKVFTGKRVNGMSKTDKKQAEQNAAEAALAEFQEQIDVLMPEHEAKKVAREEERRVKMAEMRAAKEAAGEAEEPPKKVLKKTK